ncbi:MAG: bifunctional adenosylcobinamide kinase/adenosylcobinamide-phosphate guanylyltransferase [Devosiaceae bacterium]|nr:bifunctional adenosylcobinamide kinase/adenosylcobinamide-phosphate guanylyltransferase [Devosiaceae bacterium]
MGGRHFLILGGARSGKSALAEKIALNLCANPAYIATAQARDDEMLARVKQHRLERNGAFTTFEEPLDLSRTIEKAAAAHRAIVVDCLTLWMSNLAELSEQDTAKRSEDLVQTLAHIQSSDVIFVSNEVGLGIVPANSIARSFRDETGILHQRLAGVCANTMLVVAGLPLVLKGQIPDLQSEPGKR